MPDPVPLQVTRLCGAANCHQFDLGTKMSRSVAVNGQDGYHFQSGLINALQLKMAVGNSVYVYLACAAEVINSNVKQTPRFYKQSKTLNLIQPFFRNTRILIQMGADS